MASIPDAITANNTRILKLLIAVPGTYKQKELDVGLIQAAKLGHVESTECLLDAGADIHFVNPALNTPLQTAVQNNRLGVVKTLISRGCDVNYTGTLTFTPIHVASKYGFTDILELLIENNAKINSRDGNKNTPLILAARHGQCLAMQLLIKAGCDVNASNDTGWTALHYACQKAAGYQLLLNAGANPDIKDNDNITALIIAASEGFDRVVKSLVEANCDVNVANNSVRRTALHILSFKGHSQCINNLVYGGANIDVKDSSNRTPLWYAIKNKKTDVVRLILKSYSHADTFECSTQLPSEDCPTELAFREKLSECVKFFILTGYDHTHLRECLQNEELSYWLKGNEEFTHWLDFASGAQTLKQICRKWIRHHLGRKFFHQLQFLPVPDMIKNYLYLEELHDH